MSELELITHITSKLREGHSFESIRDSLSRDGWSISDINRAHKHNLPQKKIKRLLNMEIPSAVNIFLIVLLIFAGAYIFIEKPIYNYNINIASASPDQKMEALVYGEKPELSNLNYFQKMKEQFLSEKINFIEADLLNMSLKIWKNGENVLEIPIKTKGRKGSWWETPAGIYKIQSKETNHLSSMSGVYMPWSMQFQGNFFIHGWPYYQDGTPVASTYSGGCIRLDTNNAKKLFNMVDMGYPIIVYNNESVSDNFKYIDIPPSISSRASLAIDINNNYIFLKNNSDKILPIASITKLMTALVATDYINMDNTAIVPKEAIVQTTIPRLKAGQKISIHELLYPLLMESSNEAAETIARYSGRDGFITKMNEKALSLGMVNTNFVDPSGISENNTSTAEDLVLLTKYIYNNKRFVFNITAGKEKTLYYKSNVFSDIKNLNDFADNPNFVGGKVGQTTAAKETEISVFDIQLSNISETRPILIITLGSENNKQDIESILDYISKNFLNK